MSKHHSHRSVLSRIGARVPAPPPPPQWLAMTPKRLRPTRAWPSAPQPEPASDGGRSAVNFRRDVLLVLVSLTLFLGVADVLSPADAGAQTPGPCDAGWVAPTPTVIAVTSVPITVSSTEDDYFVLYVKHDRGSGTVVNVPVSVTRGESGTTSLSDSLSPLGADKYRVEKYLVANPADVDGDCVDDITELDDFGYRNPMNPAMPVAAANGSVALEDRAAFERLSYRGELADNSRLKDVRLIKFNIVNIQSESPQLWFQNTVLHLSHVSFLNATLRDNELVDLGSDNVTRGVLIYHPNVIALDGSLGFYRWELQAGGTFAFREVSIVNEILAAAMPFLKDNLAYYPYVDAQARSRYHQQKPLYDASRVKFLRDSDIRPDVEYEAYNPAEGYGLLDVFDPGESPGPRDVAILSVLPNDLPRAAGVITTVPQTPLSHVNLRAIQNGTPNAFIRDALTEETVTDLVGSYVYYRATADGYTLRAATKAEVDDHHAASRPKQTQTLQRDLTKTSITPLSSVSFADWTAFGVKAANVAELTKVSLPTATTPVGYAVPFYFYDEFMKQATVSKETILGKKKAPDAEKITLPSGTTLASAVTQMLAHQKFQTDTDIQEEMLDDLRKAIKNATSPQWVITALTAMHDNYPEGQSLRYRSSTNNEDLPEFNGAGLYDSKTQDPDETTDDGIDKSIKAVWASLWNHRAFLERDFHRVDHTTVAMGVLVHPNYSDEQVNGVAVSFDPVTSRDGYYYVNTQLGEDLVTNPEALSLPEELLLDSAGAPFVLARSNLAPANQLLMTKAQMIYLRTSLKAIHDHFETLYNPAQGEDFAVEIEFKITAQNKLAIKQARPWVFSQPLSACVPQLPTDAVTVDEVKGWRDANNNPDHVRRWNRVLAALGVDTGETDMTVAESRALETVYLKSRWERTTRTLAAIDICRPSTARKPTVISIVAGSNVVTEGDDAEFTLTASPVRASSMDVMVEVTQSGDFVTTGSQTVTIPPSGSFMLSIATSGDSVKEADGSVTVTVNSGAGYTASAAAGSATVDVSDDDLAPVEVCVTALSGDGSVTGEWTGECDSVGRSGRYARFFTFSLDNQAAVRIDLESSWDTYMFLRSGLGRDGQELHQDDESGDGYNSRISETLAPGDYTIEATTYGREKTGAFTLTVVGLPDQAPPAAGPEISVSAGADITEGGDATFTITATPTPSADLAVTVEVTQSGDYASTGTQTVTIPTTGTQTLTVATTNDSTDEPDGSVTATISTGTGYTVSSSASAATVAVFDDDGIQLPPQSIVDSCVSDSLLTTARRYYDANKGRAPSYGRNWKRVLITFRDVQDSQLTPFTAADALAGEQVWFGWRPIREALECIEAATAPPPPSEPEISITGGGAVNEGSATTFTVTATPAPSAALTVNLTVSQNGSFGATTGADTVTIPTTGSAKYTVSTTNDSTDEPNGSVSATLSTGTGYTVSGTNNAATVSVSDDDDPPPATPVISITGGSGVTEGSDATFTVTASPSPSTALAVNLTVSQSGDYVTTGSRTVTIPTSGSKTFAVTTTDDSDAEPDGSVTATISSGTGYTVSSSAGIATVAIADNDTCSPTLPNDAVTISEITGWRDALSNAAGIKRFNRVLATLGVDTGETPMPADLARQVADWLGNTRWDRIARTLAAMEQSKCDTPPPTEPEISIAAGGGVTEGSDATFTVTATPNPTSSLTVNLTISQSGSFAATTGTDTVTIPITGSATYTVSTTNDSTDEPDGSITVILSNGTGYTVSGTRNAATVVVSDDDDPPPTTPVIAITAGSAVTEGSAATFSVTATPNPTSALTVNLTVSQSGNFGASTGTDTVTIPTTGSATFTVDTTNDNTDEADGSVTATLSTGTGYTVSGSDNAATVAVSDDDDPPPVTPTISIAAGSSVTEGGNASFTVTASPNPTSALPVNLTISQSGNFGATIGSRTVIIPTAGTLTFTVSTTNDSTDEADGSVTATLSTGTGYTVSGTNNTATVAVLDDDPTPSGPPTVTVSDASASEGVGHLSFTVTLSHANPREITFRYSGFGLTAAVGQDFRLAHQAFILAAGDTSLDVTVPIIDDIKFESDETLKIYVYATNGITIPGYFVYADGTIVDDDS